MQRDDQTIDYYLERIGELWKQHPNQRLGQLIVNAVQPRESCPEIYSLEDRQLVRKLARLVEKLDS